MRRRDFIIRASGAALAFPLSVAAQPAEDGPVARTALGDMRGAWRDGIATFYGVPYAAPPVGELRFATAAPAVPWQGQRDAMRHGSIPPQLPARLSAVSGEPLARPQGEDCLTLTICTPAADAKARPVIVWLHGGAWLSGAGSLDRYDGSHLAREGDLVFVGVNYRLGALGWLHRPGIVDAEPGASDIIAALSWVRDYIASFGGDPARVTVMGQSAGSNSIAQMLMLPDVRPLFRRVIMQSSWLGFAFHSPAQAAEKADQFMRLLDIDPGSGDALIRLREMEVPSLLRAQGGLLRANARFARTAPPFVPVVPASMSQMEVIAAIADGAGPAKDVLIGMTADDALAFFAVDPALKDPSAEAMTARFGGEAALAHYRARYPRSPPLNLLAALETDETFLTPAMRLAEAISGRGGNAYAYIFDWAPPASRFRSCHGIDLPFVFGTFDAYRDAPMLAGGDAAQMADLSTVMRRAWIAFVRDGAPAHAALPPWPRYDSARRPAMRLGPSIGIVNDPAGLG
jgi:para-nitrobenzyl esterase